MNLPLSSQKAFYAVSALGLGLFLLTALFTSGETANPILIITLTIMMGILIPKTVYPIIVAALCATTTITTYVDKSLVGTFLIVAVPIALWCYSPRYWAGKDEKMFVTTGLTATALFIYALGWADNHHPIGALSIYLLSTALFLGITYTRHYWKKSKTA